MPRFILCLCAGLLIGSGAQAQLIPNGSDAAAPVAARLDARPEPIGPSEPARPTASENEYQRVVADAVAEHEAGHWAEARALFLRAHALKPSARTFRTLGMTAFELREYPAAVRELSAALEDTRSPLSDARRKEVARLLERANAFVGRYQVRLSPPDAQLSVDGLAVKLEADQTLLLALGRHQLMAQAAGYADEQRAVLVEGAAGETLTFRLAPLAPRVGFGIALAPANGPVLASGPTPMGAPSPALPEAEPAWPARVFQRYRWTWTATAGSVALGALGGGLHRRARAEDAELERMCAITLCTPRQGVTDHRDTVSRWSTVSWGTSAALALTAVALAFWERNAAAQRRQLAMHPGVAPARP